MLALVAIESTIDLIPMTTIENETDLTLNKVNDDYRKYTSMPAIGSTKYSKCLQCWYDCC